MNSSNFYTQQSPDLTAFRKLCEQPLRYELYPHASDCQQNVLIYQAEDLLQPQLCRHELQTELYQALETGPGVIVIRSLYKDLSLLDGMQQSFQRILQHEATQQQTVSDHFANAGNNGRIWNTLEKSACDAPLLFLDYYANPLLQLISEAWLGPHYQLTSQVNIVYPGSQAQAPHRDYHLGFQDNSEVCRYPSHVQHMSRYLTLQAAVAHSDMPAESGPTMLLPFSQQYGPGYLSWRLPEFADFFARYAVQLPLNKGDGVFFNPALMHAAGSNRTSDLLRSANLLQISSVFAKPMESVNLYRLSQTLYPEWLKGIQQQRWNPAEQKALLSGCCDGYSFPSNLDTDPPLQGMAPQTHAQLTRQALSEQWSAQTYNTACQTHWQRRQS